MSVDVGDDSDQFPSSILSCDYPSNDDSVGDAPFAFETDHEALRGNADYTALLRTMAALQAQKKQVGRPLPLLSSFIRVEIFYFVQAVKDREKLIEARDQALADPIAFVKRLQVC